MELTFQKERKTELQKVVIIVTGARKQDHRDRAGTGALGGQGGQKELPGGGVTHALRQDAVGHVAWWEWHAPSNTQEAEVPQSEKRDRPGAAGPLSSSKKTSHGHLQAWGWESVSADPP